MPLDIDRFAHLESPVQRWDPRFKLASLGAFAFGVALLQSLPMAVAAFVIALLMLWSARLPFHFVSHGLEFVILFLLPFFIIMPLTYPGEPAFLVLGIGFSWEGLRFASLIFIKAVTIVLTSFAMFGSSRFDVSMIALQRLRCPTLIVQMVLFTYRYVYVFMEEMKTLGVAMRVRGFVPRTDRRTMRILGGYVGTLLVRSFERTERVYKAMLSKGYRGEFHTLVEFRARSADAVKAVVVLAGLAVLLVADMWGPFATAVQGWF